MVISLLKRDPIDGVNLSTSGAPSLVPAHLELRGHVPTARLFTLEALRAIGRQEIGPLAIRCFTGRHVADVASAAGARLVDVLDAAGFSTLPRSERKRCVIAGMATDDYMALFTWAELYNSPAGAKVLVLYERDGRPLDASIGSFDLIAAGDSRLGPRNLRGLRSVRVRLF